MTASTHGDAVLELEAAVSKCNDWRGPLWELVSGQAVRRFPASDAGDPASAMDHIAASTTILGPIAPATTAVPTV